MTISTVNLVFGIPSKLRSSFFIASWVKKGVFIRCCGDYKSSNPVRYVSNKYPKGITTWQCKFDKVSDSNLKSWSHPKNEITNNKNLVVEEVGNWPYNKKIIEERESGKGSSLVSSGNNLEEGSENVGSLCEKKSWPPKPIYSSEELDTWPLENNNSVEELCDWLPKISYEEIEIDSSSESMSSENNLRKESERRDSSFEKKTWPLQKKFNFEALDDWSPKKNLKVEEVLNGLPKKNSWPLQNNYNFKELDNRTLRNEQKKFGKFSEPLLLEENIDRKSETRNSSLEKKSWSPNKNFNVEKVNNWVSTKILKVEEVNNCPPKKKYEDNLSDSISFEYNVNKESQIRESFLKKKSRLIGNFNIEEVESFPPRKSFKNEEVENFSSKKKYEETKFKDSDSISSCSNLEKESQRWSSSIEKEAWPLKKNFNADELDTWPPTRNLKVEEVDNWQPNKNYLGPISPANNLEKEPQKLFTSFSRVPAINTVISSNATEDGYFDTEDDGSPYLEEEIDELDIEYNETFEVDAEQTRRTKRDAENFAISVLAKRAFTVVELKKKLQKQKFPQKIIENLLADFHSRGLINDYLYAETFSQSRFSYSTWAPKRIERALLKKGVTTAQTENARKYVFEGDDFDGNSLGMSETAMSQLLQKASKQWLRHQKDPFEKRTGKDESIDKGHGMPQSSVEFFLISVNVESLRDTLRIVTTAMGR
ncbi:hypothetical protein GIB67_001083 [Kingdonia uniflora]|uniref:Regulatory protein RecX n=1 Tax=Kingdonia uniflora TaxID=39325 RepID=A0A7J7MGE0_9MAGN|nr:hypothetical protein GIB67_001083 [Kingdonia uniflora]